MSSQCDAQIRYSYEYSYGTRKSARVLVLVRVRVRVQCVASGVRWWWLQHPSKDDEACAISGKRITTSRNSKLNTSIRCGVRRGADFVIF